MNVNDRRIFAMALVLMALMSLFVPAASAAGSQDWYLCTSNTLSKAGPGSGSFNLPAGSAWTWWTAGPAQCDLTMDAETWYMDLDYTAPGAGAFCVEVWNKEDNPNVEGIIAGKFFVSLSSGTNSIHMTLDDEEVTVDSVDFDTGDHLAIFLGWDPDGAGTDPLTINYGSGSKVTSPTTDPGYPVPELSTLALYSVGLLALAGYVVYRRRLI